MFSDPPFTGYGAVIRNENADVMASFSVRGSKAVDSSEAELLACRRAIQFAIEVGITDAVIEGVHSKEGSQWGSAGAYFYGYSSFVDGVNLVFH